MNNQTFELKGKKKEELTIAEIEQRLNVLNLEKKNALKRIQEIEIRLNQLNQSKADSLSKIKQNEERLKKIEEEEQAVGKEVEEKGGNMVVSENGNISEIESNKESDNTLEEVEKSEPVPIEQQLENLRNKIYANVDSIEVSKTQEGSQEKVAAETNKPEIIENIKTGLLDGNESWPQDKGLSRDQRLAVQKNKLWKEDPDAPYVVENIAKYTKPKDKTSILRKISNWIWENKKPLAIPGTLLAASAVLGGKEYHDIVKGENIRNQSMKQERLGFETVANWVKNSGRDTTLFNQLGGEAQMRYASMVLEDYQEEQRLKNGTPLSVEQIKQREKEPQIVQPETMFELALTKISGGDYAKPVQENTVIGKYGINMRAWGDTIGIPNADGLWDLKEVHNKRYLQDQYVKAIFENLHGKYGDDMQKVFAGFLKPDTGPQDVGTPAGDVPFDESGMTVNKFVDNIMPEYTKIKNATENGGRFIVDNENQKLYFVDLKYKPTYELDIYDIKKGDNFEAYMGVIESGKNTNYKAENIMGYLHQMSKTIDYAEYVAGNKIRVSSEDINPGKVFEKNNEQRMGYVQDHPGEGKKLNPRKEVKNVKKSRIMNKDKINS